MTDPLRSDPAATAAEVPERDRDARVEELLLSGLDQYFSGQHEQAINIWTRVLFLDRGHARARAYIERARSAVSERQREGDELVHEGAAAFQRGDGDVARSLLTSALERGAASEEAMALLGRLDRVAAAGVQQESRAGRLARRPAPDLANRAGWAERGRLKLAWVAAGAAIGVAGVVLALTFSWARGESWLWLGTTAAPAAVVEANRERLPVPAAAEVWITRARALFEKGRLREALLALDGVPHGDLLRPAADELRATVQQRLLESAGRAVQRRPPASSASPSGRPR